MTEEATRALLATFRSVFPHVVAFKDRDLILIGSREPITFSFSRMQALFERPAVRESLGRAFLTYPADLLVQLSLDEDGAERFARGGRLNTDDNMWLELAAPRSLYQDHLAAIQGAVAEHSASVVLTVSDAQSESALRLELAASLFTRGRNAEALAECLLSLEGAESFDGFKLLGQIRQRDSDLGEARMAWERALTLGGDPDGRRFVATLLQSLLAPAVPDGRQ